MWNNCLTAVFCLIALLTEVTLDTSTSFVRVNPMPAVGKLVIIKTPIEKKQSIPQLPDAPNAPSGSEFPYDDGGTDDLLKYGTAASHAGQVSMPVSLSVEQPISRFIPDSDSHYREPRLSNLQKPPSA